MLLLLHNMGSRVFILHRSSRASLTPYFYNPLKTYTKSTAGNHGRGVEEKAPSLADEFKRVAEEKKKAEEDAVDQGIASQTADKACDGTEEAVLSDGDVDRVERRNEEHEPGADYRRRA